MKKKHPIKTNFDGHHSAIVQGDGRLRLPLEVKRQFKKYKCTTVRVGKMPGVPALTVVPSSYYKVWKAYLYRTFPEVRSLEGKRMFFSAFHRVYISNDGRIYIPLELRKYAKLSEGSEVVWLGLGTHFELWNALELENNHITQRKT